MRGHTRSDGLLEDYCDGTQFKQHPLFCNHPKSLQIMLYFDEVEVCNPLGSKVNTHKLGKYYITIYVNINIMYVCMYIMFTCACFYYVTCVMSFVCRITLLSSWQSVSIFTIKVKINTSCSSFQSSIYNKIWN